MRKFVLFFVAVSMIALACRFAQLTFQPHPEARFAIVFACIAVVVGGLGVAVMSRLARTAV